MERAVRTSQLLDATCIADDRFDLEPVADDAGILQQAVDIGLPKTRDPVDLELGEGGAEGRTLLQHRKPGQPGLVDFEGQALEQHRFVARRETVFPVVIRPVQRMPGRGAAVGAAHLRIRES